MTDLSKKFEESVSGYGPQIVGNFELLKALTKSREFLLENPDQSIGSYQLEAHFNLCIVLNIQPESWEIYESARVFNLPLTNYYTDHRTEIINAIDRELVFALLKEYARAFSVWKNNSAAKEKVDAAYIQTNSGVLIFDFETRLWHACQIDHIKWEDGEKAQEKLQKILAGKHQAPPHEEIIARAEKAVEGALKKFGEDHSKRHKDRYEYEKSWLDKLKSMSKEEIEQRKVGYANYLKNEEQKQNKLSSLPPFRKNLFALLRQAENAVRQTHNVPAVGEGWVSETELFYRIKQLLPDREVIHHGKPLWLERQHLDIWIPSLNIAVEYQGLQHFKAIDFFGGEKSFQRNLERDARKKKLCADNGTSLIEVPYDTSLNDNELKNLLNRKQ